MITFSHNVGIRSQTRQNLHAPGEERHNSPTAETLEQARRNRNRRLNRIRLRNAWIEIGFVFVF